MRRVFVAGGGAVTPFGAGAMTFCEAIFAGRTALKPLGRLAGTEDCLASVAAEVAPELADPERLARQVMDELNCEDLDGFVLATTKADLSGIVGPGDGLGNPYRLARRLSGVARVAAVSCACASGLSGLALAGRWIATGAASRVLVVGVDTLSAFVLRGFSSLLALSPGACRPYDQDREGLSLGEAAGAILLTADETLVELAGWGETNDANHITGPSRDGAGLCRAAQRALWRGGLDPDDVDYIHTHGTGTPFNDAMEGEALLKLFDGRDTPPVSGTKAQTGHTLGAAGVIESIVAIEALRRATAPANVGLVETDLDARVRLVREPLALPRAHVALKLSAGFGGINAAVVFRA